MFGKDSGNQARAFAQLVTGVFLIAGCPTDDPAVETGEAGGIDSVSGSATDGSSETDPLTGGEASTITTTVGDTESSGTTSDETDPGTNSNGSASTGPQTTGMETTTAGGAELSFLEVTPGETILEVDLNTTATQDFIVTANYDDGSTADVTAEASWTIDNAAIGAMAANTLNVPAFASTFFDSGIVTATVDGEEGQAQITVAAYQISGAEPDFFFVLPYNDPAGNQDKPLTFDTDVKALDVFINMDTSGSMGEEIQNLQSALTTSIIPDIQAAVPNTRFGAGTFEDFPIAPVGRSDLGDQPFLLLTPISNNVANVQAAVAGMSVVSTAAGGDFPESNTEALYQIATGQGLAGPAPTSVAAHAGGVGGVEFREGAFPVVVSITDALSHDSVSNACVGSNWTEQYPAAVAAVAHSQPETITELNNICARAVQIAGGGTAATCNALQDGIAYAEATGAVVPPEAWDVGGRPAGCGATQCCTGLNGTGVATGTGGMCPMVYTVDSNGTGVDSSFSDAVELLAAYGQFDVSSETTGGTADEAGAALPAGSTTADFIKAVTPFGHGLVPLPGVADPTLTPTQFLDVIPDTDVTFTIEAYNDFVMQGQDPRIFVASIRILADDCGDLDEREVFILVPPLELPAPG